jgi:UDP-2,3-diacylglucosamine pyrophosphatase LpxH
MNAIVVSDLHIGSRYFQFGVFERFLEKLPPDNELILNGDVIDSPYIKMGKSEQRILDLIEETSYRQRVVWVRGNHDNGYVPKNFGKIICKNSYSIDKRLLIAHGHCFDDIMPRSLMFIRAFELLHRLRIRMGARPVHVAEYAKKWKSFYRALRKNVASNAIKCAAENGFEAVACGHTHYPEDFIINGIRYINTGAWTEFPAYYLHINADKIVMNRVNPSFVSYPPGPAPVNQDESAIHFIDAVHRLAEADQDYRNF